MSTNRPPECAHPDCDEGYGPGGACVWCHGDGFVDERVDADGEPVWWTDPSCLDCGACPSCIERSRGHYNDNSGTDSGHSPREGA